MYKPTSFPVARAAKDRPQAEALRCGKTTISYAELERRVRQAAGALQAAGFEEGDYIAFWMPNTWEYVVQVEASFRIGAIVVPLSVRHPVSYVVERLRELNCRRLVVRGEDTPDFEDADIQCVILEDLLSANHSVALRQVDASCDRPATIVFSSGSTGRPKAILHTWGNHYYSALGSNRNIALSPGDRWMLSLPLYHVAGLAILFRCFAAGAAVVLPAEGDMPEATVQAERITHVSWVGAQLLRWLDNRMEDAPSLRAILLGGSAIPRNAIERAIERDLPIHTSYGMTETASQATATPPGAPLEVLLTSGRSLDFREVRCRPDGEICVRGEVLFAGYIEESRIVRPFDEEGWFRTGDLGYFDDDGWLHVTGRLDNRFISGGENINPEEIERVLESYPEVVRAIVVPVPDDVFGCRPVAIVESRVRLDKAAWDRRLDGRLARFMLPVAYIAWEDLHVREGMKVSRKELAGLVIASMRI